MNTPEHAGGSATLADYIAVLRRRKWIVLQAVVLVPLAALLFSLNQVRLYQASAEVLLSRENLAASLTGVEDPLLSQQADRIAETQAQLARVPAVVAPTLREAGVGSRTVESFLATSTVSTRTNSDLLVFSVTDRDPALAARLATAYARQFSDYKSKLDTAPIVSAREEVQTRLGQLDADGDTSSALYRSLVGKEQQLATMEALRTSNASVVRSATDAVQVQPRLLRNAVLAVVLGLLLGIALAFLWEALDTRLRSADDIAKRLGLPLLGRLPEPPRKLRANDGLVMLDDADGTQAEAFRMLRTNLDFARLGRPIRTIMVTSAVEQEGKSTTAANLAVALARAGKRVVLVDLDLRRPYLDHFFGLNAAWGVTHVVLGRVTLDEAMTLTSVAPRPAKRRRRLVDEAEKTPTNGDGAGHGALHVLPSGPIPPNPGEFVGTNELEATLARLREQADIVVVDAPPLLHVGDALTLSSKVDGLLLVTRLGVVRKRMVAEVRRLLDGAPAEKLGFVVTAAEAEHGYGYGYAAAYYGRGGRRKATEDPARAPV